MTRTAQNNKPNIIKGTPSNLSEKGNEALTTEVKKLFNDLQTSRLPPDLTEEVRQTLTRLDRAMQNSLYQAEFEQAAKYIEWLVTLPWDKRSADNLDLGRAKKILDKNHYGLDQIKERIAEYLAVLKLQTEKEKGGVVRFSRSPVLCFVGLPGTGKTSLGASIAESLGREFVRIPMGGLNSPLILRGQSRAYPEAEPGMIMKGLRRADTKNPVVLLDEIDSIAQGAESDVMGVLLELLDPEQNFAFTDYYIDYPFDLSEVLFVCSANKAGNLSGAVMDRLEVIIMPRYTDDDKIHIARDYLLPKEMENVALNSQVVSIAAETWPHIIKPFGYDVDIRSLQRTINGILRRVGKKYVEGKLKQVTITPATLPEFLPDFV
ncbi:MAG: AAA family ATPase [bacterium]|nr:AAA family ATPase [bacterium]